MTKFLGEQNQFTFKYESGTYANASGAEQWIGMVQEHKIDEEENIKSLRYLGVGTRNVDSFRIGQREVKGTFTYYPQDWKMLGFTLGSVVDSGSPSPYIHTLSEMNNNQGYYGTSGADNPFPSFTLVDTKDQATTGLNFIRTLKGVMIDSFKLKSSMGEVVEVSCDYVAQDLDFSSGVKGDVSKPSTDPYIYSDIFLSAPSGTSLTEVTDLEFSINNGIVVPFYLNGSRITTTPMPTTRDYELKIKYDMSSSNSSNFYNSYYRGGSEFNSVLQISRSAGSRDCIISLSGCRIKKLDIPTPEEGVTEVSMTIQPKTCSVVVNDAIFKYNFV